MEFIRSISDCLRGHGDGPADRKNVFMEVLFVITWLACCSMLVMQPWGKKSVVNSYYVLALLAPVYLLVVNEVTHGVKKALKCLTPPAFVFAGVAILAWILTPLNALEFKYLRNYLLLFLFPLIIWTLFHSRISMRNVAILIVLAGLSYGVSAIYYRLTVGGGRIGLVENAVNYGNSAFLISVVAAALAVFGRYSTLLRFILGISAIAAMYAAVGSGTRGSFIALPVLLFFCLLFLRKRIGYLKLIAIVLMAALSILWLVNWKKIEYTYNNVTSYLSESEHRSSAGQRLELWRYSVCVSEMYPILGVGPGGFKQAQTSDLLQTCNDKDSIKLLGHFHQAHSVYFQTLATTGYSGLLAFLSFFALLFYWSCRQSGGVRYALQAAIITILGYGLTVDLFFYSALVVKHIGIIALLLAMVIKEQEEKDDLGF